MFLILDGELLGETLVTSETILELDKRRKELLKGDTSIKRTYLSPKGLHEISEEKSEKAEDAILTAAQALQKGGGVRRVPQLSEEEAASLLDASRVVRADKEETVRFQRQLVAGDTVNLASLVQLWHRSVETVIAQSASEVYGIRCDVFVQLFAEVSWLIFAFRFEMTMFFVLFLNFILYFPHFIFFSCFCCFLTRGRKEKGFLDSMQEQVMSTLFQMVDDPEALSSHGVPLFYLHKLETAERERDFVAKVAERDAEFELSKGSRSMMHAPIHGS